MLTFTAPWSAGDQPCNAPSTYLRMLAAGLQEGHGWDIERTADYLASLPGAQRHWSAAAVAEAIGER